MRISRGLAKAAGDRRAGGLDNATVAIVKNFEQALNQENRNDGA